MKKILFIASTSYTGSTLLSILLGSHSDICTVSQMVGPNLGLKADEYTCSCGRVLTECSFWDEVGRHFEKECGHVLNLNNFNTRFYTGKSRIKRNLLYRSLYNPHLESIRDKVVHPFVRGNIFNWENNNKALIHSVLKVTGAKHFLDASKDPVRIKHLAQLEGFQLYVLHVVRDVRGFVNSSRKNNSRGVIQSTFRWILHHSEIERRSKNAGTPYKLIRYEDFAQYPNEAVADICKFAGIQNSHPVLFNPKTQHLLGNRMRLKDNFDIRIDESWKTELTIKEKNLAFRISKNKMRHFGYI